VNQSAIELDQGILHVLPVAKLQRNSMDMITSEQDRSNECDDGEASQALQVTCVRRK
jgi:hypothetical protein